MCAYDHILVKCFFLLLLLYYGQLLQNAMSTSMPPSRIKTPENSYSIVSGSDAERLNVMSEQRADSHLQTLREHGADVSVRGADVCVRDADVCVRGADVCVRGADVCVRGAM